MHIALIGASGFIGSALRKEALARGHHVTALVSHPDKLAAEPNLNVVGVDVLDQGGLAARLKGFDAVLSAFSGHAQSDIYDYYMRGIRSIIAAAKAANVPRLLVVGGAGSLLTASGAQSMDEPGFPDAYKATAEGARQALDLLRRESGLNWTMLSPSAVIAPGRRTGQFRLGGDRLLVAADGGSHISLEDYAMAMIDELETPAHPRQRFTVGY
jgi:putative NADH-flavin reductase